MNVLRLSNVSVTLAGRLVVNSLSFEVAPGELVGVIGPNGAGKSSLLRAIAGLIVSQGEITHGPVSLQGISPRERARRIAYLPQDRDVAWPLDVGSVVALGRLPYRKNFYDESAADDDAILQSAMADTDVAHLASRPVTELSGGERSRVLLARAFAQATPILLADEPAAGLDLAHQLSLIATLQAKCAAGATILCSLHELDLAARCSRLVLLDKGMLVADGKPADVLTPGRLAEVYGVRAEVDHGAAWPHIRILDLG